MTLANNKRKGAAAEIALLDWLRRAGYSAVRQHLAGPDDEGDILIFREGVAVDVVEVKSGAHLDIPGWLRELDVEVANVIKVRPGVKVRGWLVVRPKGVVDPAKWWVVRRAGEVW